MCIRFNYLSRKAFFFEEFLAFSSAGCVVFGVCVYAPIFCSLVLLFFTLDFQIHFFLVHFWNSSRRSVFGSSFSRWRIPLQCGLSLNTKRHILWPNKNATTNKPFQFSLYSAFILTLPSARNELCNADAFYFQSVILKTRNTEYKIWPSCA